MTSRISWQELVRHSSTCILGIFVAGVVMTLAGCASTNGDGRVALEPLGPGHVFPSIEAAVVDAMAFSVIDAKRSGQRDRMYGGPISAVDGGYTYEAPVVAPTLRPLVIRYRLGGDDVARFHVYPEAKSLRARRDHEHGTDADRASVDQEDPGHRPLYILTPTLVVRAYYGEASSIPMEAIAQLDRKRGGVSVLMMASSSR